ncbi:MAG: GGDEF domain-containing protein [Acholeplasmatales bacterium]|nr:GGDEF domain-containing protein [Acholeplasmatales bacterium]
MELINDVFFKDLNKKYIYDSLTGVLSREYILKYTQNLIDNNEKFTLFFIDLDYFKDINDILGHKIGDDVLKIMSDTIKKIFKDKETICGRFGGDEFIVIYKGIDEYNDVWKVGESICKEITYSSVPDSVSNYGDVTVTIGIASYPRDAKNFDELFDKVDKALYRGKLKGRNCFIIYNEALHGNIRNNAMSILNTDQLIQFVFNELNDKTKTVDERITKVLSFVARYYNIDYASIYDLKNLKIICKSIIADRDILSIIPQKVYDDLGFNNSQILAINFKTRLNPNEKTVHNLLRKENIRAELLVHISSRNNYYGYLRMDLINERVWQKETKLILQIVAQIYANLLEEEQEN